MQSRNPNTAPYPSWYVVCIENEAMTRNPHTAPYPSWCVVCIENEGNKDISENLFEDFGSHCLIILVAP